MALTRVRADQISDIDYKQAVRVITLTSITLSGGAPSQVDSVNLAAGDRVLVAGQSTGSQNGLYQVSIVGSGSNGTWVRTADGNATGEIQAGMIVMVTEGTIWADTSWKLTTNNPITIGSTALSFSQNTGDSFSTMIANGVSVQANTVSSAVTYTPGNNFVITGNNTADTIIFAVSDAPVFTGNVTAPYFVGNGSQLTGLPSSYANANVVAYGEAGWAGNIIPDGNAVYTLGNSSNQWKSLYVSGNTIYIDNVPIGITGNTLTVDGNSVVVADPTGTSTTTGNVSITGNIAGGNVTAVGIVSATGNVTGNYISGNGSQLSSITGSNVTGTVPSATSATTAATVTTNAQPNITSVGTLSSLSVTGNITGDYILGNGSLLTGLPATYSNVNVAAYLASNTDSTILAIDSNISNTNSNVANLTTSLGNTDSNVANLTLTVANLATTSSLANTNSNVANLTISLGNTNSNVSNLSTSLANTNSNVSNVVANVTTLQGQVYTDANVAAYLPTYTGNLSAGNVITTANGTITNQNITIVGNTISSSDTVMYIDPAGGAGGLSGNVVIQGNLTVNGTTTTIDSNVIVIDDLAINLANNAPTASDANGAGLEIGPVGGAYITWLYNNVNNTWVSSANISAVGNIAGTYFLGNGSQLTGIPSSSALANTDSNVANLTTSLGNTDSNVANLTTSLANTNSNVSNVASNVTTLQGQVYANANVFTYLANSNVVISTTGNITGSYILGNGSQLTGLPATYSNVNVAAYLAANTDPTILAIDSNISNTNSNVANLTTSLGNTNSNVSNLTLTVANLATTSSLANTNSNVANLTTSLGNTDSNVSNLSNSLSNTNSNVSNVASNVTTLQGQVYANANVFTYLANSNVIISTTGNITGDYILGNGTLLTGIASSAALANTDSNVANLTTSLGNTNSNVSNIANSLANTDSNVANIASNVTTLQGQVYANANAQSYLASNANVVVITTGNITTTGNVSGNYILGNGALLTGLAATYGNANVADYLPTYTGTIAAGNASITGNTTTANLSITSTANVGNITFSSTGIKIGLNAGAINQGANAIAIGTGAGFANQPANSIILNATGTPFSPGATGFFVNPIRGDDANIGNAVYFNPSTYELTYSVAAPYIIWDNGGDMGLVTEPVTVTQDLGLITAPITVYYDLGVVTPDSGTGLNILTSYTVATLPSASAAGAMVYVTNAVGGAVPAFADGLNWYSVVDRTLIA